MGNLVRDPELRVTPGGLAICKFSVATSRQVRQTDGVNKEETTFVDVESFGKTAETVAKFFQKGRPIFVEGRLRVNEWQNNAGEKRSKMLVVLENFVFVGSKVSSQTSEDFKGGDDGIKETSVSTESAAPIDDDVPF
jgi:single-strand DNA-binding protein